MICMSMLLYADDLLQVAPSVASLQHILSICEAELDWLDMRISPNKSSCIRFGARFRVVVLCSNISTSGDSELPLSDNFRYIGVYLRSSRSFAFAFSHVKHSMYRAFNVIFGRVGRIASPDVVVQLVKTKSLQISCYAIEVCPANNSDIRFLQYILDNRFGKIFDIKLKETVEDKNV